MKNKGVQEVQGVQGAHSPLGSESIASHQAQDITFDDIISAAHELRDEENAQISAEDLDLLIGIAPNTDPIATRHAEIGQQSANHQLTNVHGPAKRPRWWAAAACLLGFIAGFGVKSALPSSQPLADIPSPKEENTSLVAKKEEPTPTAKPDTILLREVVRDTVYLTRVVQVSAEPKAMVAQAEQNKTKLNQAEQKEPPAETPPATGCSMLCDDIPYAYLAHN